MPTDFAKTNKEFVVELEASCVHQGRAEERLEESEGKYRLLFEREFDAVIFLDARTHEILDVNPAALRLYGYSRGELVGKLAESLSAEEQSTSQAIDQVAEEGFVHVPVRRHRKKDGTLISVEVSGNKLFLGGRLVNCSIIRDITERKKADEARRESEERYRQVVEGTDDIITRVDVQGRFTYVNHAAVSIFGLNPTECLGLSAFEFIHPDDRERTRQAFEEWTAKRVVNIAFENCQVSRSGEARHILWTCNPLYDEQGEAVGFMSIGHNVTNRKRLEQEHLALEEKYSKAFNLSPDVLVISTLATGEILELSRGFELATGYSKEEAVGKTSQDLNLLWDASEREPVVDMLRRDGWADNIELRIRTKSGECRYGLFAAQILHLVAGDCILTSFRDITERKKAEKALQDKEEALQQQARDMEEMNAALTVLLARRDQEKQTYEKNALNTLKTLVFPFLEKLSASDLSPAQESCLATVIANLNSVYSPFAGRLAFRGRGLTPSEIYIVELIRQGRSSKEIAQSLGLSAETILTHRKNIRAKFGLQNQKVNLFSFLQSLESEPHD